MERHDGRRKPQGIRAIRHPPRQPGDRTRRAAPAGPGVQVATTDQTRTAGVGAFSRRPRKDSGRDRRKGRGDARRTLHRLESVLGRPDSVAGSRHLQPRLRSEHRLRPHRSRIDATRVGKPSRRAAVLAPVLSRRRDRAGGDAGEPLTAGSHIRGHQPVVRLHGAVDAPLRRHLPATQARRSAVQVRAAAVRRLHRREAVQPQLVDRGHPVAHRKDVAAQARSARLRRRRLPRRSQRRHPSAAGVDQLRPIARDRRIRRLRPRRREDARRAVMARQLHQGRRASATTARSTSASPKRCRCASTSASPTAR